MNLSHVATLQNEVKSCNLRADLGITNFLIVQCKRKTILGKVKIN